MGLGIEQIKYADKWHFFILIKHIMVVLLCHCISPQNLPVHYGRELQ